MARRPRVARATLAFLLVFGSPTSFVPWHGQQLGRAPTQVRASSVGVPVPKDSTTDAFVGKPGRAGGGGGDGPTPEEKLQVLLYRVALAVTAVCWTLVYTLDFFMTSGISIIDGSVQAAALAFADVSAAVALLAAPTGSRLVAGLCFRLLGAGTLLLVGLGMTQGFGAVPGPLCVVLLCAREIFWFGWFYKVDALWGALCFVAVCAWRLTLATESTSEVLAPEIPAFETWEDMPKVPTLFDVRPIGPPVPLSFACWISLSVLASGKIFEPLGEDLDEAGERWSKRSSRSLYDTEDTDSTP